MYDRGFSESGIFSPEGEHFILNQELVLNVAEFHPVSPSTLLAPSILLDECLFTENLVCIKSKEQRLSP